MFDRNTAVELWHKYNESESLWHHALSVEAVMRESLLLTIRKTLNTGDL